MPDLSGSVGHDGNRPGDNKIHDVCLVQAMLRAITIKGKSYVGFAYDGGVTKNKGTHNAIQKFQTDHALLDKKNTKDKSGLVAKGGKTFEKMVELLPADKKKMRTIAKLKLVYLEGNAASAKASESSVTANTQFVSAFKKALAKLIRDMYKTYGIVLTVVPNSGAFRSFEDQSVLYAKGRSTGGNVVTGAGPGESNHNYGNGADLGMVGFKWISNTGRVVEDKAWLNSLAASSKYKAAATELWKLRNKLTTLHASGKSGDLVHIQSYSDAKVSMRSSLVKLLNKAGNMTWEFAGGEYKSNYGLGDKVFNIGSKTSNAQSIWKKKCDVSGANLATALNQATTRRTKAGGALPANQEQIYTDLMSVYAKPPTKALSKTDIKKAQYDKMRDWLKKDFELAEADYKSWTS